MVVFSCLVPTAAIGMDVHHYPQTATDLRLRRQSDLQIRSHSHLSLVQIQMGTVWCLLVPSDPPTALLLSHPSDREGEDDAIHSCDLQVDAMTPRCFDVQLNVMLFHCYTIAS